MAKRRVSARLLIAAVCLAGGPGVLPGQGPDAELAELVKRRIDAALARTVRELRVELHRIVDESLGRGDPLGDLLRELERTGGRESGRGGVQPRPPERVAPAGDPGLPDFAAIRATWEDLGLRFDPPAAGSEPAGGGLGVARVEDGSPAARAGLKPGDRIARAGDRPALLQAVFPPGGEVALAVFRHGPEPASLQVALSVPDGPAILARRMVAEMTRRAMDQVIPSGGAIVPGGSPAPPPDSAPSR